LRDQGDTRRLFRESHPIFHNVHQLGPDVGDVKTKERFTDIVNRAVVFRLPNLVWSQIPVAISRRDHPFGNDDLRPGTDPGVIEERTGRGIRNTLRHEDLFRHADPGPEAGSSLPGNRMVGEFPRLERIDGPAHDDSVDDCHNHIGEFLILWDLTGG
jgi:hypothetical protein